MFRIFLAPGISDAPTLDSGQYKYHLRKHTWIERKYIYQPDNWCYSYSIFFSSNLSLLLFNFVLHGLYKIKQTAEIIRKK